jgi:hypothetical protein
MFDRLGMFQEKFIASLDTKDENEETKRYRNLLKRKSSNKLNNYQYDD